MIYDKSYKLFRNPNSISYKILIFLGTHQNETITYITELKKYLDMKYTTLVYWITKFNQEGLIYDGFRLTSKGNKIFESIWNFKDMNLLRAHNIQIKFYIDSCPKEFVNEYSDKIFTLMTNKRYIGLNGYIETSYGRIGVSIYSRKKIVCTLKDIYAESDDEIISTLEIIVLDLITILEKKFKGIKINDYEYAKIQTMHIAFLNSNFSKKYNLGNITYEGKNIAMDNSHSIQELELTNPKNNLRGIEILKLLEDNLNKYI